MISAHPDAPPWHLQASQAPTAWLHTLGEGSTIAILDSAIDTRHQEFAGRIVAPMDMATNTASVDPTGWQPHGTKVAGVAAAGGVHIVGVAPRAGLMPVRVKSLEHSVGSIHETEAIMYAATHGADVICCPWSRPPPHDVGESRELPAPTRDAMDWATHHGRGGRGCIIVFAAGNDGLSADDDPYCSHHAVVTVGAVNPGGRRPGYSNTGRCLWCCFPSCDPDWGHDSYIRTTSQVGSLLLGNTFYDDFGFTSAAAGGVAGVIALILSANPELSWREVKNILRETADRIDPGAGEYDSDGHSPYYGYGRVDAARAVERAMTCRVAVV